MEGSTSPALWWQEGVVYQIYPRSFQDSNGDGIGDLPGITQRLDYLHRTLGITAIWLSPFYPSPMADFGYDVANYLDVDPIFGTLQDFDRLVRELHSRDMRIIIDFVPNHTSSEHPWFQASRASRDNPKRDWYVWRDAKPDGSPPNNWLSLFGGSGWQWDEATGQYYLHSFLKEQPDLNWRNPEVQEAMLDVLRFWMDRGVDGFRIDVAHFIMKDPEMRDNPPNPQIDAGGYKPMGEYDSQLHLYDHAHPDVHEAFRAIRRVMDSYSQERPRMSVAEIHVFDWNQWATYYGVNSDEIHMPFNFGLLHAHWEGTAVRQVVDGVEAALPPSAWPNYVLGNHDERRITTRVGPEQARVAMMLLLTLRGTPTMYYGDELGMKDAIIPPDREQDPWGKRVPGMGRDPERSPMQWDAGPNAGFCPPGVEPWLPLSPDFQSINVATESSQQDSMLSLTRQLLALRQSTPALTLGSYRPIPDTPLVTFVYVRELDGKVLVALNFSGDPQTITLPDMKASIIISTHLDRTGPLEGSELKLRANEGCVLKVEE